MKRIALYALICLAGLIQLACRSDTGLSEESQNAKQIAGLIPEHTIEGRILGQYLKQPNGIASDNAGDIYLLDGGNRRIIKFNSLYEPVRDAGGYGRTEGLFVRPSYISIDNNLNLYVTDSENHRISIFDRSLNYANMIKIVDEDDALKFGQPIAASMNKYSELWVTEYENSRIDVFNTFNVFDRYIGDDDSYTDLFLKPSAIEFDNWGNGYVSDYEMAIVYVFDNFGTLKREFGQEYLLNPTGISFDRKGRIWICDSGIPAIVCFDNNGRQLFIQEDLGSPEYTFKEPGDLTVLPGDKIAVCDTGNNRVLIYKVLYQ